MSGWWDLTTTCELNDVDREHIASLIREGCTSGEIIHEEETEGDEE